MYLYRFRSIAFAHDELTNHCLGTNNNGLSGVIKVTAQSLAAIFTASFNIATKQEPWVKANASI